MASVEVKLMPLAWDWRRAMVELTSVLSACDHSILKCVVVAYRR